MTARIMIVDDEEPIRDSLQGLFEDEGYLVVSAASGEEAMARLRKQSVDCVLLDIWMPGIDGLETLSRIHQVDANLPVIMMSGHATIDTAVRATRQGAFDFVEKPLSFDRLMILCRNAVEKRRLEQENSDLKRQEKDHHSRRELIGQSAVITEVKALIKRVALSDSPVLIVGEHGTGKAVAAALLHEASKRRDGPFVEVNTASMIVNRMDSELFGHEKGAFTGANPGGKPGQFELAHEGILFLDEIAELTLSAQVKLLRFLEDGHITRLGGTDERKVDVRVLAATHRDLEEMVEKGTFRLDLYYRLNVFPIYLPPLRERRTDVLVLADFFLEKYAMENNKKILRFSTPSIDMLMAYHWPGNVRELENTMERLVVFARNKTITTQDLVYSNTVLSSVLAREPLRLEEMERLHIMKILQRTEGNKSQAARLLGIDRKTLRIKIKKYQIPSASP